MKLHGLFKEYIWIINTVYRAKRITLSEINELWLDTEMSRGKEFSRLAFWRHRQGIQENFGIHIECDRRTMGYYICNESVMHENSLQNWMLNTLSVNNIVSDSISMDKRIVLEAIAGSSDVLETLVKAMKRMQKVQLTYQRYGSDTTSTVTAEPYCIKLWNKRWYTLLHFFRPATNEKPERDYFGVYSIDRIRTINVTSETFTLKPDFDANEYFSECFGILAGDGTPAENIVVRAYGKEIYSLRGLPMHHSQKEVFTAADYADFSYYIRPATDFIDNILARGSRVKVISPSWLANKVKEELTSAINLYGE